MAAGGMHAADSAAQDAGGAATQEASGMASQGRHAATEAAEEAGSDAGGEVT